MKVKGKTGEIMTGTKGNSVSKGQWWWLVTVFSIALSSSMARASSMNTTARIIAEALAQAQAGAAKGGFVGLPGATTSDDDETEGGEDATDAGSKIMGAAKDGGGTVGVARPGNGSETASIAKAGGSDAATGKSGHPGRVAAKGTELDSQGNFISQIGDGISAVGRDVWERSRRPTAEPPAIDIDAINNRLQFLPPEVRERLDRFVRRVGPDLLGTNAEELVTLLRRAPDLTPEQQADLVNRIISSTPPQMVPPGQLVADPRVPVASDPPRFTPPTGDVAPPAKVPPPAEPPSVPPQAPPQTPPQMPPQLETSKLAPISPFTSSHASSLPAGPADRAYIPGGALESAPLLDMPSPAVSPELKAHVGPSKEERALRQLANLIGADQTTPSGNEEDALRRINAGAPAAQQVTADELKSLPADVRELVVRVALAAPKDEQPATPVALAAAGGAYGISAGTVAALENSVSKSEGKTMWLAANTSPANNGPANAPSINQTASGAAPSRAQRFPLPVSSAAITNAKPMVPYSAGVPAATIAAGAPRAEGSRVLRLAGKIQSTVKGSVLAKILRSLSGSTDSEHLEPGVFAGVESAQSGASESRGSSLFARIRNSRGVASHADASTPATPDLSLALVIAGFLSSIALVIRRARRSTRRRLAAAPVY